MGNFNLFTTLLPFVGAGSIAVADHYIKEYMEEELPLLDTQEMKKGIFRFRRHHNKGAFMNVGDKHPEEITGMSLLGTGVTAVNLVMSAPKKGRFLENMGLAMILGGALSNTEDRIKKRYVVDYASLDVKNKKIKNIIFNLSDVCIGIGTLFVVIANLARKD